MHGDRDELAAVAVAIGFLPPEAEGEQREAVLDFVKLGSEPFAKPGVYDFAASNLPTRAREEATRLAFGLGFRKPPPAETLFVQRKLGGTFLLCARLGARFDARAIMEAELEKIPAARPATCANSSRPS